MTRYIDADILPKLFDEEYKATRKLIEDGETHLDNLAEGFSEAARVIRVVAPIANVQEVVRCKNCIFFDQYDEVKDADGLCVVRNCETDKEEFCSYGGKRGDEK